MAKESREVWAKRVERWKDSGLTAAEFAAETGINMHSLSWWKWRLGAKATAEGLPRRRSDREVVPVKPTQPITFVEVAAPASREHLELVLARGTVRVPIGFDVPTLERLLGVLERSA